MDTAQGLPSPEVMEIPERCGRGTPKIDTISEVTSSEETDSRSILTECHDDMSETEALREVPPPNAADGQMAAEQSHKETSEKVLNQESSCKAMLDDGEGGIDQGEEVISQGQEVIDHGEGVISQGERVIDRGGGVISQGERVIDQGEGMIDQGEGVIGQGKGVIDHREGVINHRERGIGHGEEVISQGQEVIHHREGMISQRERVTDHGELEKHSNVACIFGELAHFEKVHVQTIEEEQDEDTPEMDGSSEGLGSGEPGRTSQKAGSETEACGQKAENSTVKLRARKGSRGERERSRLDSMALLMMKLDQLDQDIENALSSPPSVSSVPSLTRADLSEQDLETWSTVTSPTPPTASGAKPKTTGMPSVSEKERAGVSERVRDWLTGSSCPARRRPQTDVFFSSVWRSSVLGTSHSVSGLLLVDR
ncbi:hypothetical protein MATL_G00221870 [Megalops atlanticus]|uniref:Uncharacterized protein n=1 Tax=Megalops atlanticus TaxID=7932 RepID=A0A9D3PHB7_MEGAT|nr:hypothetical protein MATL_G00221870 [Megalops atlanticus]